MALSEETKTSNVEKPNVNSSNQKSDKREKPLTKVIIRRLPPAIDKDTLLNQISPVPNHDYFYLVNGESALGENSFSRAYLNFLNPNDVFEFKEKFDNYVFLDNKGNEYAAVVEFSAFQKIPKKRNKIKVDPKCGSIETDPYFLEFVENLNKPVEQEDKPEYSYQFLAEMKDKDAATTPLLEFVKNRRVERMRIREERREERKRKELERKKLRDEDRKKRFEEKSPLKGASKLKVEEKEVSDTDTREDKEESNNTKSEKTGEKPFFKGKEKKFDDRRKDIKPKHPPRKEYPEKREFKNRKEHYKEPKFDSYKKEEKQFPKKVKKYSEKREERKIEAQKAELKKAEELEIKKSSLKEVEKEEASSKGENSIIRKDDEERNSNSTLKTEKEIKKQKADNKTDPDNLERESRLKKEVESESSKETRKDLHKSGESKESRRERIRNKDRPTMTIYRPGMLSKRKLTEGDGDKEISKETNVPSK